MNKPLLSICIPTYNRASYLKECLASIVVQYNNTELFHLIEIVISDNASEDNTSEVVSEFQKKYNNIFYYPNKTNRGFDRNILNAVEKSSGQYCFTLGDDDTLFPEALTYLMKELSQTTCPYFFLNSWGYNRQMTSPAVPEPAFDQYIKIQYATLQHFVESITKYQDLVGYFAGMSNQLFSRKKWMDCSIKNEFIGTQVAHLYILLSTFQDDCFGILPRPIVKTRANNIRWDTYPGLETARGRANSTLKTALWIKNKYSLSISTTRVKFDIFVKMYVGAIKGEVKKVLRKLGLKKW